MNRPLFAANNTGKLWDTPLVLRPDGKLEGNPAETIDEHLQQGHVAYVPKEKCFGLALVTIDADDAPDAAFWLLWKTESGPYALKPVAEVNLRFVSWLTCADYLFPRLKETWDVWNGKKESSDEGRMLYLIRTLQKLAPDLRLERQSVFDEHNDEDGEDFVWCGEKVIFPDESALVFSPDGLEMQEVHAVNMQLMALDMADAEEYKRMQFHDAGRA